MIGGFQHTQWVETQTQKTGQPRAIQLPLTVTRLRPLQNSRILLANSLTKKDSNSNFSKWGSNQTKGCSLCSQWDHTAVDNCPNIVSDSGCGIQMMPSQDICTACNYKLNHPPAVCPFRVNGPLYKSRWLDGGRSRSPSLAQSDSATDSLSIKSGRIDNQQDMGARLMQLAGMGNISATSYMANSSQSLGVSSLPSDVEKKIFATFYFNNFRVIGCV